MNKKAQIFKEYLQEKNINCFQVQEIANDAVNTVVFRSTIAVENQELPTAVILDNSIFAMIRVRIANLAVNEEKQAALTQYLNDINSQYKIFKYYLTQDGSLVLDSYILNKPEEVDGDMIYTVLDIIIKHLVAEYKNIMKAVWA
jgi:hypothetical protein